MKVKIPQIQQLNNYLGKLRSAIGKLPSAISKLPSNIGKLPLAISKLGRKDIIRMGLLMMVLVVTTVLIFAQTVAWQTNVVHTGGLMFSADTWDFSADVSIGSQNTLAFPGDSGVIDIEIANDSADLAAASIKVLKEQINSKMRSRIYFYVDTTAVRYGETINRVYINDRNSYTYTIFPHNELMLKSDSAYQPLVKWEWTYDNLGYYVYGKKNVDGTVEIQEYLRPIEYDFDYMRTTFASNGRLETIDGQTTAEEFLITYSKTDGYEGQIAGGSATALGYYPVKVNEQTGYGIFAYLCTLSEINQGSLDDTQFGANSESIGQATVKFTGQNCRNDGVLVFDENSLKAALSTPGLNILTLNQDITLTQTISAKDSAQVVIDLAGHKITSTANTVIDAKNGASVMVSNGEIHGNGGIGVNSVSSSVTLSGVTITNVDEGVAIYDNKGTVGVDSAVHLKDCNISASEDGLLIYGNAASEQKTTVIVEECNINGENYAGIICNGAQYGTDINITNSTIKGKYTAIYFPQKESTLTVKSSILEGYTGLAVKGGTVNIVDCTITGTGEYTPLPDDPSKLSNSGWCDTGDGVYLESNYTQWQTKIYISGDKTKITGSKDGTLAVRKYPADSPNAFIEISGGDFSSDITGFLKEGYSLNSSSNRYEVTKN